RGRRPGRVRRPLRADDAAARRRRVLPLSGRLLGVAARAADGARRGAARGGAAGGGAVLRLGAMAALPPRGAERRGTAARRQPARAPRGRALGARARLRASASRRRCRRAPRLAVRVQAGLRPRGVRKAEITPNVTLIVPAYNEETVIRRRLENLLALDYPAEQLEIVVSSDGSDDGTDAIVEEVAAQEPRVRLRRRERAGKL